MASTRDKTMKDENLMVESREIPLFLSEFAGDLQLESRNSSDSNAFLSNSPHSRASRPLTAANGVKAQTVGDLVSGIQNTCPVCYKNG